MNLNSVIIADAEFDSLLEDLTKCHVLSIGFVNEQNVWEIRSTNDRDSIQSLLGDPEKVLAFHNGLPYDKRAFEKLGYTVNCTIIDTLSLSWMLYPDKMQHGVAAWAKEMYGDEVGKVEIEDWKGLSYEEYKERCEVDTKLQIGMWVKFLGVLRELYDTDAEIEKVINYSNFKMECLVIQDENQVLIDVVQCQKNSDILQAIVDEKVEELKKLMPEVPVTAKRKRPAKPFKKDGTMSNTGQKWFDLMDQIGYPHEYDGEVIVTTKYIEPNPQSVAQMKTYLFTLGWEPSVYKKSTSTGDKVPQLKNDDDEKTLCRDIDRLIESNPSLQALSGLSVAQHRLGYLTKFLKTVDENGYMPARANGFAKTLRLKHGGGFQNLPKPTAAYGEFVRSVMVAPEGYVLVGSDISSLEDQTKKAAIFPYDPDYVNSMSGTGYDSHLEIGVKADMLTAEEVKFYRWFKRFEKVHRKEEITAELISELQADPELQEWVGMNYEEHHHLFEDINKTRASAKTVNYSSVYGVGAQKLSESIGRTYKEAKKLLDAYWEINWAVKQYAADQRTKTISDGREFIYNPISKLWLLLTSDHLRFSVLNQNAGVKVFDYWCYEMIQRGIKPIMQFHDEVGLYAKNNPEDIEKTELILRESMQQVNKIFNFPFEIEIDVMVGKNYAEVH